MMTLEKRWALLHALIEKTQQKKISWETGPTSQMYYSNLGGLGVAINPEGQDLLLLLFDENGNIVESISDVAFANAGYTTAYPTMSALYDLAKAEATGSEKVVDALLYILKNS